MNNQPQRSIKHTNSVLHMMMNTLSKGKMPCPVEELPFGQVTSDDRTVLHSCAVGGLLPVIIAAYEAHGSELMETLPAGSWQKRISHIETPGVATGLVHPMILAAGSPLPGTYDVMVWYIEQRNVPVHRMSHQCITALHAAIAINDRQKVAYLISRYSAAELDELHGGTPALALATPIGYAAYCGHTELVKLMMDAGANINKYCPASEKVWPTANKLVSPLAAAIANLDGDNAAAIDALLRLGADPNQAGSGMRKTADSCKALPLFLAMSSGYTSVVITLLRHGANPCETNCGLSYAKSNMTFWAVRQLNISSLQPEVVDAMVAYGGSWNPHHRDVVNWKTVYCDTRGYNKAIEIESLRRKHPHHDRLCVALNHRNGAVCAIRRDLRPFQFLRKHWSAKFLMAHAVWKPTTHHAMPAKFKAVVLTVLTTFGWLNNPESPANLPCLPPELQFLILSMLDRASCTALCF